ncbi:chaperone protein DnaK [Striga asiatica]|uniref:Chaperone protein DnaK n=1 Tax=Striga asiatica TaxID=4170 RepID=A0A5A7Q1T1_STRAF|nr:chaperone protein DnaK [Striga asiatica]
MQAYRSCILPSGLGRSFDSTISLSAIHACALGYLNPVGFLVRMLESNSYPEVRKNRRPTKDRSSNGDVYKEVAGSSLTFTVSQTELLSRLSVAEAELVLSTLAAFFAIASVEWLRDEGRVQSLDPLLLLVNLSFSSFCTSSDEVSLFLFDFLLRVKVELTLGKENEFHPMVSHQSLPSSPI